MTRADKLFKDRRDSIKIERVTREFDILVEQGADSSSLKRTVGSVSTLYDSGDTVYVEMDKMFDSSRPVVVPKKYLDLVGVEHFEMFEPYYGVRVRARGKLVVTDTVRAMDIQADADSSLRKWGVLQFSKVKIEGNLVVLEFDYVVPLSDVGFGVDKKYRFR